jgi:tetratricopeptide (TPR) repeat protein
MMLRILLALVMLLGGSSVARAEWHEVSSPHFVIYANDRPDRIRKFAETLERYDQAVRLYRSLPNEPVAPAGRLTIYVLGSANQMTRLSGSQMVAGFYIGRASGSVAFVPRLNSGGSEMLDGQLVLFHEYTHHMMFSIFAQAAFPAWLVEGWAEYHATAKVNADGSVTFGIAANHRAMGILENAMPLTALLDGKRQRMNDQQADSFYGRSWLLTHYLTFDTTRRDQFSRYILAINDGKSANEASKLFGDLKQLDRELDRYARGSLIARTIPADKIKVGAVTARPLSAGETAVMQVRIQSHRGVDEKTAPGVYAAARTAAAPFPDDPGAQIALAEAAFDASDYDAALAACDRALKTDPKAMEALIYKAMTMIEVAARDKDTTPARWSAIRKVIGAANRLDPEHPEPLILYYRSFIGAEQPPSDLAKDGLMKAFQLAPFDEGLRLNAASMLIDDGKPAVARTILLPLANHPHDTAEAKIAREMIASIDKGDDESEAPETTAAAAKPAG